MLRNMNPHPTRKPGRMIVWTLLGKSDLQSQPKRSVVPLPNPDKLGIDTLIYFWEKTWGARIPWNEGLRSLIVSARSHGSQLPVDPSRPVKNEGRVPVLYVPVSIVRCQQDRLDKGFLGMGIPLRRHQGPGRNLTGATRSSSKRARRWCLGSLWDAGRDSESDKGNRIESLFNISFWAKEGAIDWNWLGLETPGKERTTDSLAVAMEIAERNLVNCLLDSPWPCAMAVLRVLQMCEPNDLSVLQMPSTCPWCGATLKLDGNSLYMQIWNYACHVTAAKACVCCHLHWYPGGK